MVQWTDEGILTGARLQGENHLLVSALTLHNGHHYGLLRLPRKPTSIPQMGTAAIFTWKARLQDQLGVFQIEPLDSGGARFLPFPEKLLALHSACTLTAQTLPERDPDPALYQQIKIFLTHLQETTWIESYILFELALLKSLGFALNLSSCAASGTKEDLIYVSPRSGRAVSRDAGAPYKDRLFPLPPFVKTKEAAKHPQEMLAGLDLTCYFFKKYVLDPYQKVFPLARSQLRVHVQERVTGYSAAYNDINEHN